MFFFSSRLPEIQCLKYDANDDLLLVNWKRHHHTYYNVHAHTQPTCRKCQYKFMSVLDIPTPALSMDQITVTFFFNIEMKMMICVKCISRDGLTKWFKLMKREKKHTRHTADADEDRSKSNRSFFFHLNKILNFFLFRIFFSHKLKFSRYALGCKVLWFLLKKLFLIVKWHFFDDIFQDFFLDAKISKIPTFLYR